MKKVSNRSKEERIKQIQEHIEHLLCTKTKYPKNIKLTIAYWQSEIQRLKTFKGKPIKINVA